MIITDNHHAPASLQASRYHTEQKNPLSFGNNLNTAMENKLNSHHKLIQNAYIYIFILEITKNSYSDW